MDFNVARLFRDGASLPIGEGTTDVLATDVVEVLKGKIGSHVIKALDRWIKATTPATGTVTTDSAAFVGAVERAEICHLGKYNRVSHF